MRMSIKERKKEIGTNELYVSGEEDEGTKKILLVIYCSIYMKENNRKSVWPMKVAQ